MPDAGIRNVAFSPDGKTLAAGGVGGVHLWDVATGGEVHLLGEHSFPVWSVVFSPDGHVLASGSFDTTVRLWDAATGRVLCVLSGPGHVRSVTFSPDGKVLVSAHSDGTLKLWDVVAGKLIGTIRPGAEDVLSVAFGDDGRTIVCAAGADILIYDLHANDDVIERWLAEARQEAAAAEVEQPPSSRIEQ